MESTNFDQYKMTSTSLVSSTIEDIPLGESETGLTRRVIRAKIVENHGVKENSVEFALVHQRRANSDSPWADLGGKTLSELKAGEASKMSLDTKQTKELLDHLQNLYRIGKEGVRSGETVLAIVNEDEVIQTDKGRARIIRKLLEGNHNDEVWQALIDENPTLATKMSLARIYNTRKKVVEEFEQNIGGDLDENYWQNFLTNNTWIFGMSYVGRVRDRRIDIQSTVDHPLITEDGCLDIIEIKRPDHTFWRNDQLGSHFLYRNKYLIPSVELLGAITQASNYILELEKQLDSVSWAQSHDGVVPLKPRCVVVVGRSKDWGEQEAKAFRLLNDSLHGISVQTFDHLLLRAKGALEMFNPESAVNTPDLA